MTDVQVDDFFGFVVLLLNRDLVGLAVEIESSEEVVDHVLGDRSFAT